MAVVDERWDEVGIVAIKFTDEFANVTYRVSRLTRVGKRFGCTFDVNGNDFFSVVKINTVSVRPVCV